MARPGKPQFRDGRPLGAAVDGPESFELAADELFRHDAAPSGARPRRSSLTRPVRGFKVRFGVLITRGAVASRGAVLAAEFLRFTRARIPDRAGLR
jgi:hypothetical protein